MAKRPLNLKVRIPPYRTPRNAWRRDIHKAVLESQKKAKVSYGTRDRLEIRARLYLHEHGLFFHDVDNRLKDIMDALQGRVGGTRTKKNRLRRPIIPNDSQVWRVTIEKGPPPGQSHGFGHLVIRKFKTNVHRTLGLS